MNLTHIICYTYQNFKCEYSSSNFNFISAFGRIAKKMDIKMV